MQSWLKTISKSLVRDYYFVGTIPKRYTHIEQESDLELEFIQFNSIKFILWLKMDFTEMYANRATILFQKLYT